MSRRRRPGYVLRLGDSNRRLRRELSSTLAVGWSSMSGIWPSERGRKSERTVRKSRVHSRLWRRTMPSWLLRGTLPSKIFFILPAIDGEIFVSVARLAFRLFKLFRQSVSSLSVLKSMLALGENFLRISTSFHVVLTVSRGMRV